MQKHFLKASGWGKQFHYLLADARSGDVIVAVSEAQKELCERLKEKSMFSRKRLTIEVATPDSDPAPAL